MTVTLLASLGFDAAVTAGAVVVTAGELAEVGAAGVAAVVEASVDEPTLAAVVVDVVVDVLDAICSGGATTTAGAGSEAAPTSSATLPESPASISVDLFTWSPVAAVAECLWWSGCGWKSLIILVSFPLGSIRLLSLMSWSCALAGVAGSRQLEAEVAAAFLGSSAPEPSWQAPRTTSEASRRACFLFSVSISKLFA